MKKNRQPPPAHWSESVVVAVTFLNLLHCFQAYPLALPSDALHRNECRSGLKVHHAITPLLLPTPSLLAAQPLKSSLPAASPAATDTRDASVNSLEYPRVSMHDPSQNAVGGGSTQQFEDFQSPHNTRNSVSSLNPIRA